ncbi:AAA domain-containing protein [Amycolatopsis cihanbeyliensis]|uniref:AAA domain-containing protein n=1 Tax=Amycolatopsis cihanbeyliensis TaxID=1128664 RepID=A0A542DLZ3_AMYCI|nr:AAA domain-containing protein [Amycolatopsis cihanbeyliensis]TQJ04110.1 AAA domain-containing protein [Amycolatopsis cihanbeyliensis]
MTDWREDAARAVDTELNQAWHAGEWSLLGVPVPRPEPGQYTVDLRGRRLGPDNLGTIRLAGRDGPHGGPSFPVEEVHAADGVLRLRVTGPVPAGCDRVWAATRSPRELLSRLAGRLRNLGEAPLADRLAAGELDPVPDLGAQPPAGLLDGQAEAYRACHAPGLRLVWTPPGTGSTHVLVSTIESLVKQGKRVLFVSGVDSSLDAVAGRLARRVVRIGAAGRVGPPPPLPAEQAREIEAERAALDEDLAELDRAGERLAELDTALVGYDHTAFLDAGRRIDNADRLDSLEADLAQADQRHTDAATELAAAQEGLRSARAAWAEAAEARTHLERARDITEKLRELDQNLRERTVSNSGSDRLSRAERKALRTGTVRHDRLRAEIEACREAALPCTEDDLGRLDAELAAAERALDLAARTETSVRTAADLLRRRLEQTRAAGIATEQDRRFHAACLRHGLPERHQERETLRARVEDTAARDRLTDRLRWLAERAAELRAGAEAEAVREAPVVATTPARAYADECLSGLRFDVVLAEHAAAARLAEMLFLVSRADHTAVLFGDFLQPGPVVRPANIRAVPEVRRWSTTEVFGHCGITAAEEAMTHPGCVTLTRLFRFGSTLRTLTNDLHYRVLRDAGMSIPDTELVLVDTSMLPDLTAVRRGGAGTGWWSAGLLLARALAERHPGELGVVTASSAQAAVSLAAVRELDPPVPVATAHACRDINAQVIVFDLVGGGPRARRFGSAISRADRRLYLPADLRAVRAAPEGTPLAALHALLLDGRITVRGADSLLDLADADDLAARLTGAEESLWLSLPWIGGEDVDLLPLLAGTARRGVDVHAVLPSADRVRAGELADCGVTVHTGEPRQKVAVVDRRTVLFGTTHDPSGCEVLITCPAARLAKRLLADLHGAPEASRSPAAPHRADLVVR